MKIRLSLTKFLILTAIALVVLFCLIFAPDLLAHPKDAVEDPKLTQARVLMDHNCLSEATVVLRQLLDSKPDNQKARLYLAITLGRLDQYDAAMAEFFQALRLNCKDPNVRFELGKVMMKQGSWDEAEGQFQQVLDITPGNTAARVNLGICLEKLGQINSKDPSYQIELSKLIKKNQTASLLNNTNQIH